MYNKYKIFYIAILYKMVLLRDIKQLAKEFNVDTKKTPIKELQKGFNIELEHKRLTKGNKYKTFQIVVDHISEFPDYYKHLEVMEKKLKNKDIGKNDLKNNIKGKKKNIEGGAITDIITNPIGTIKTAFSPITSYNNISLKTLADYGDKKITGITVARTPLNTLLKYTINALSMFQFSGLVKQYGFDNLYHTSLICTLEGAIQVIIEKNEVVYVQPLNDSSSIKNNTQTLKLMPPMPLITLNQLMQRTQQLMGNNFWTYDGFENNCQVFIISILQANNILIPKAKEFLFQNLTGIKRGLFSYVPKVMRKITDLGSIASRLAGRGTHKEAIEGWRDYAKNKTLDHKDKNAIMEEFLDYINSSGLKYL